MKWRKLGLIFKASAFEDFEFTHVQCPVALEMTDRIRVFFSSRSKEGKSRVHFVDLDLENPARVIQVGIEPVVAPGPPGAFDQDGALQTSIVHLGNTVYLFYGGFSRMTTVPHTCTLGLAISTDGGHTFTRTSDGPVLGLSQVDPYLIGSADVIVHEGIWHMVYTSGKRWKQIDNKLEQAYSLKYATSTDGIKWDPTGREVIAQSSDYSADCRPSIVRLGDTFHMYFSARKVIDYRDRGSNSYRFGYATSKDLINWERKDSDGGITVSDSGWDSEMICYSYILQSKGRTLMFYNGNNFGKDGLGLAILASS